MNKMKTRKTILSSPLICLVSLLVLFTGCEKKQENQNLDHTPKTLKLSCVTDPEGYIPSIVAELDQPVSTEDLIVYFTFTRTATTGSQDPWMMQFPVAVDSLVIFFFAGDKVASSIIAGNCGTDNACSATYMITDAFCPDPYIYDGKLWPKKFIGQSITCSFLGAHL